MRCGDILRTTRELRICGQTVITLSHHIESIANTAPSLTDYPARSRFRLASGLARLRQLDADEHGSEEADRLLHLHGRKAVSLRPHPILTSVPLHHCTSWSPRWSAPGRS